MNRSNDTIIDAMDALRKAMRDDPAYAYAWHSNVAMAMYDAMPEVFWLPDSSEQLKIANKGASRFMKLTFNVVTSQDMLSK